MDTETMETTTATEATQETAPAPLVIETGSRHDEFVSELARDHDFLVLMFYRGMWCGHCQKYCQAFQKELATIEAANGAVVGICAENAKDVDKTAHMWNITYPLLSDPEAKLARFYNLAISSPSGRYVHGMSNSGVLVVASDGTVLYQWVSFPEPGNLWGANKRPHPRDVVELAKEEMRAQQEQREAALIPVRTYSKFNPMAILYYPCRGRNVPDYKTDTLVAGNDPRVTNE